MPWARIPGLVAANTITTLAPSALATHIFRPVRLYAAPSSTSAAAISTLAASVPAFSSDSAKAPVACPVASGRSHASFWAVGAEPRQHVADERVVHDQDGAQRGARPRDRFDGQRVADVIAAAAAPRLRNRHAREPVRASQLHERPREVARLVDSRRRGLHVRFRKGRDFLLEGPLVGGQVEIHG